MSVWGERIRLTDIISSILKHAKEILLEHSNSSKLSSTSICWRRTAEVHGTTLNGTVNTVFGKIAFTICSKIFCQPIDPARTATDRSIRYILEFDGVVCLLDGVPCSLQQVFERCSWHFIHKTKNVYVNERQLSNRNSLWHAINLVSSRSSRKPYTIYLRPTSTSEEDPGKERNGKGKGLVRAKREWHRVILTVHKRRGFYLRPRNKSSIWSRAKSKYAPSWNRHRSFRVFASIGFAAWCRPSGNFEMDFEVAWWSASIKPWNQWYQKFESLCACFAFGNDTVCLQSKYRIAVSNTESGSATIIGDFCQPFCVGKNNDGPQGKTVENDICSTQLGRQSCSRGWPSCHGLMSKTHARAVAIFRSRKKKRKNPEISWHCPFNRKRQLKLNETLISQFAHWARVLTRRWKRTAQHDKADVSRNEIATALETGISYTQGGGNGADHQSQSSTWRYTHVLRFWFAVWTTTVDRKDLLHRNRLQRGVLERKEAEALTFKKNLRMFCSLFRGSTKAKGQFVTYERVTQGFCLENKHHHGQSL